MQTTNDNLNQILVVLGGSRAYGLHTEQSDVDLKGVFVAPEDYYLGLKNCSQSLAQKNQGWFSVGYLWEDGKPEQKWQDHQKLLNHPIEGTCYEITRFFELALQCNPNILDVLFCDEEDILFASPVGKAILLNRFSFLSKTCFSSFKGYALHELSTVEKIRLEPPNIALVEGADLRVRTPLEMQEKAKKMNKHAAHTVRILQSFEELALTGAYRTKRPNIEELRSIRDGNWTLDWLKSFIDERVEAMEALREKTPLPDKPDYDKVNELCVSLVMNTLGLSKKPW